VGAGWGVERDERADEAAVGAAVGHAGSTVGNPLGSAVGKPLGSAVGKPLGSAVGKPLGSAVGKPLGSAVGKPLGSAVGKPAGSGMPLNEGGAADALGPTVDAGAASRSPGARVRLDGAGWTPVAAGLAAASVGTSPWMGGGGVEVASSADAGCVVDDGSPIATSGRRALGLKTPTPTRIPATLATKRIPRPAMAAVRPADARRP